MILDRALNRTFPGIIFMVLCLAMWRLLIIVSGILPIILGRIISRVLGSIMWSVIMRLILRIIMR